MVLPSRAFARAPEGGLRKSSLVVPGVLAAGVALGGLAVVSLALLVLSGAAVLGRGWRRAPVNVPAALTLLTVLLVSVAQLAAVCDWRLFASPGAVRLLLAGTGLAVALAGAEVARRSKRAPPSSGGRMGDEMHVGWALLPALIMAAYGLLFRMLPMGQRVEWFLGGDNIRHLWFAAEEAWRGNLGYAVQSSPRAWHTVIVTAWSAQGASIDGPGLMSLVSLMSTCLWFAFAVLSLAISAVADLAARRMGLQFRARALAGVLAGSAVLWPTFLGNYMVLGFETAIFCAVLLAAAAIEVLLRPASRTAVVVTAAAGVLVAHTWQLLLPAAAVAALTTGWAHLRIGMHDRSRWALLTGTYAAGLLVAWPSLVALTSRIGFERASIQGVPAPSLSAWLPFALIGAVAVLLVRWRDLPLRTVALMSLGTAVLAVVVAVRAGVPITHYYPRKMLWQACLLGLPLAVVASVAVAETWRGTWGTRARGGPITRMQPAGLRVLGGAFLGCVVALSWIYPAMAVAGPWSHVDGDTVLDAASAPRAAQARVVWLGGSPIQDTVTRVLLDFYRVSTPLDRTIQYPAPVGEECQLFAGHEPPTVLSPAPTAEVAARYSCVTDPVVIRP